MTGTRLAFAILLLLSVAAACPAEGLGLFHRKSKMEPARVRLLAEIVRSDPDEKKRKAAVAELAGADPRVHVEVIPTLIAAVRKDASATVRAGAAEVIGRLQVVFPLAGLALETASETDPSPTVRDAARQALWEYHLIGYRSARGFGERGEQTVEPPYARLPRVRVPVVAEPPTADVVAVVAAVPPSTPDALPPLGLPPGPRVTRLPMPPGARTLLPGVISASPTVEPPLATPVPGPTPVTNVVSEPPILPRWPEPRVVGKPPPLALDLPPLVTPPDVP